MDKKPQFIPAILTPRFVDIEYFAGQVVSAVDTVQLDLVDTSFSPNPTWWFSGKNLAEFDMIQKEERGMPYWESINYELDLMIQKPLAHIDQILMLGPSRIIFHLSTLDDESHLVWFSSLPEVIRTTVSFSLAITRADDLLRIEPYRSYIDDIQCMGIEHPGAQKQPFDERVLSQIQKVREHFPDKTITVDGSVNEETIGALWLSGATRFAVGSALFQSGDILGTLQKLEHICMNTPTT